MHSVSEGALIARINRRLASVGERLRTCSCSSPLIWELGRHYVVNENNFVVATNVVLDVFARDLEVAGADALSVA